MTTINNQNIEAPGPPSPDLSFKALKTKVVLAGCMHPQRRYYLVKIGMTLIAWVAGWVAVVLVGNSWWQLLVAVFLSQTAVQLAFIFHDAGHKEIAHSRSMTEVIGYFVGNLMLGVSFGWWVGHHSKHHSNPNHLELDPDITRKIAIFTPEHAGRREGWKRWVVKHQAKIYFPFTSLDTLRLRVASVQAIKAGDVRRPKAETALLVSHFIWYFAIVFISMDLWQAISSILLYHVLVGIHLGMSFAPNHKGMPTIEGESPDWMQRQALTSRNVRPGVITDFMYGGLNYQIEHHLFPTMPRNRLKRARPIVQEHLQSCGIGYSETSIVQSMRDIVSALEWASEPVRRGDDKRVCPTN